MHGAQWVQIRQDFLNNPRLTLTHFVQLGRILYQNKGKNQPEFILEEILTEVHTTSYWPLK